jgi:N-acyl-D-amino-acid deacylase
VRDQNLIPLEEAIRKITSMPAQRAHLNDRGLIRTGFFADITVFDPATIIDEATYQDPNKLSKGVDYVLVNGQVEFDHGGVTGVKAGRPLRGPGWSQR